MLAVKFKIPFPEREVFEYTQELFPADKTTLFRQVMTTTYSKWDGLIYGQTDAVAMGGR